MNRLIRNRDILVIILLIVIICLFNFHISHGDRAPNHQINLVNKMNFKTKFPDDNNKISQLTSISLNNNTYNETNITMSMMEMSTTLSPLSPNKENFFNEIISSKDYWTICSDRKSTKTNFTLDEELFKSNKDIECPSGSFVVFLVISKINNYKLREKIRQSWASIRQLNEAKLNTLFFVYSDRPITPSERKSIELENQQYYDVVHISTPFNMKTELEFYLKVFQFSVFSCLKTEYFILVNDATFINLPTLFDAILTNKDIKISPSDKKSLMLCKLKKNVIAVRNKKSSWYVSMKEWPDQHYPPYCDLSNGVIMSQTVIRDLLLCSFHGKKLWINDVFLTGVIPRKLSIKVEAFMEDFSTNVMKNHYLFDDLTRTIFLTDGMPFNDRIWRLLLSKSLREL